MGTTDVYRRVIARLAPEKRLSLTLAVAGVIIAVTQLAEPIIFGRMIDRLSQGSGAFAMIGLWAAFGLSGILASTLVAIMSDRLAHRSRMRALSDAFSQAITLPVSFHARNWRSASYSRAFSTPRKLLRFLISTIGVAIVLPSFSM